MFCTEIYIYLGFKSKEYVEFEFNIALKFGHRLDIRHHVYNFSLQSKTLKPIKLSTLSLKNILYYLRLLNFKAI